MNSRNKNIFQIPVTDYSFKQIFATDKNKRYLIAFLNCFISRYVGEIEDVTYLSTEKYGTEFTQKKVVFDIFCTDTQGRNFIIEMQRAKQYEYIDRSIVYLSRAISESVVRGIRSYRLIPTYSVNVLDFTISQFKNEGDCFKAIFYKDQKNRVLTEKVGIFYMNLCNFATSQSDVSEEMRQWLYLLKNMQDMDEMDFEQQRGIFRDLMEECRISKLSTMEKEHYEKSVLEYEDVQGALQCAREEASEEGYALGLEKGLEKGIEQGIEQGEQNIIHRMFSNGMNIDAISNVTGLSKEIVAKMVE